jgi:hypothetical protein
MPLLTHALREQGEQGEHRPAHPLPHPPIPKLTQGLRHHHGWLVRLLVDSRLHLVPIMTRKRDAGEELLARAKANGYQRGAHKDKDQGLHKHIDKTKKDQDAALNRYVL